MASPAALRFTRVFGNDYAYLDSGAPPSTDYTTWVIVHGMGFNGAVFEKLLPLAHAHNLRIVSLYRRGYSPSGSFTEAELSAVGFGKKYDEAEAFFRGQGTEIAIFLTRFATEQGIPSADRDARTGGIVLIGWSLASIHVLMLLAYADELPEDTKSTLQKYLQTIFSHDMTSTALGTPPPDRHDTSLWLETDDRKRFDAFFDWVAGHFIHKSVTSRNIDDLEFNNPSDIPRSLYELSDEQRAKYTSVEGFASCDGKLLFCDPTAFAVVAKRALLDKSRAEAFPNVRVRYLASGRSGGALVWAVWRLEEILKNPKGLYGNDAEVARDVKYIIQEEGNHLVFWEEPEKAIEHYSTAINL